MNMFFNANHSPIGAYASFTLGFPGAAGGPGMERSGPADTNVYIGVEKRTAGSYQALLFYKSGEDESKRYDVDKETVEENGYFDAFHKADIHREFQTCSDTWTAGDLTFSLYSQAEAIPDPLTAGQDLLKAALVPAVFAEVCVDNRGCDQSRRVFFGYDAVDAQAAMRRFLSIGDNGNIAGIGQAGHTAIFTADGARPAIGFCPECILGEEFEENWQFNNGKTALLIMDVPADTVKTFKFAICFYKESTVTYGIETKYYYTTLFQSLEEVGSYALEHFEIFKERCINGNKRFSNPKLSLDQQFMMSHAIRSYYNSSELLIRDGQPIWVINEGEFRMMNTMDLTVDQLFFEMAMNPWTVKNELDFYLEHYSYTDKVCFPGDSKEYEGGLTFCHDMGVANQFTAKGQSSYEKCGLTGCFSYMSHEQLVNWLCCALVYYEQTKDKEWMTAHLPIIKFCFGSMLNRDHPDEALRNGVMGLDSSRTRGGAEITTYDSLDVSLGQSRNNIYLAGKCWAVYVSLRKLFGEFKEDTLALQAGQQAAKCAATIVSYQTEDGYIPAVIGENNDSRIIPAIEGLVFPYLTGCREALDENGEFGTYIKALKKHFTSVMKKGICQFEDGSWKISSTSNNSWLSKIYLCEFVARKLLGFDKDTYTKEADEGHVKWLTHPQHSYWCWSDQIVSGVISASKYYPRGVTSILWMME